MLYNIVLAFLGRDSEAAAGFVLFCLPLVQIVDRHAVIPEFVPAGRGWRLRALDTCRSGAFAMLSQGTRECPWWCGRCIVIDGLSLASVLGIATSPKEGRVDMSRGCR